MCPPGNSREIGCRGKIPTPVALILFRATRAYAPDRRCPRTHEIELGIVSQSGTRFIALLKKTHVDDKSSK